MRDRKVVLIVLSSALILAIGMGARRSLGLFLSPITTDLGIGRESYSLALALHNLIFGLPLMGFLADRYGARWILVLGGLFLRRRFSGCLCSGQRGRPLSGHRRAYRAGAERGILCGGAGRGGPAHGAACPA